ncbi:MAG: CBS domain-containing protein [Planctomycetes bacterium]|nr:CBS domain-containing protein [Planctomycetota bacterium]
MNISEFEDAYEDQERIRGTLLATSISELGVREPLVVDASVTVGDAVEAMNQHHTGYVLVEKLGRLVGIFTERDVLTRVALRDGSAALAVEEVMTPRPETLEADETVSFALNKMSVGGYRHIPIVDRAGKPLGVLSVRDVVDFLVELFPEDVLNLPPTSQLGIGRSLDGG